MTDKIYKVEGMACEGCANTVQKKAAALAGVESAEASFEAKNLKIKGNFDENELKKVLQEGGFTLA